MADNFAVSTIAASGSLFIARLKSIPHCTGMLFLQSDFLTVVLLKSHIYSVTPDHNKSQKPNCQQKHKVHINFINLTGN